MNRTAVTGQVFGRLTIVSEAPTKNQRRVVVCLCSCGATKSVLLGNLRNGHTSSCGCFNKDVMRKMASRHGLSNTQEHNAWMQMRQRCYNLTNTYYANYGGRGITVCERWRHDFQTFMDDMGPKPSTQHSLDRIDNNGPYAPDNCRWATRTEQNRNTRNNRPLTLHGRTQFLTDWAKELGISKFTIFQRLRRGWSVERALSA